MSRLDFGAAHVDAASISAQRNQDVGAALTGTLEEASADVLCLWRRDHSGRFPFTCWLYRSCCLVNEYYWPDESGDHQQPSTEHTFT